MKHTLHFCLFLLLSAASVQAQITYTNINFQQAGDVVVLNNYTDSTLMITPASSTATNWDFSTWVSSGQTRDTILAASSGSQFSQFSSAEILQPLLPGIGGISYVDVTATAMTRIGGGLELLGFTFIDAYQNPHTIQTAPFTYPSLVQDGYELNIGDHIDSIPFLRAALDSLAGSATATADSIRLTLDGVEVREVDAFGTCMLSDSTYDVLRQKVMNIVTVKVEAKVKPVSFLPAFWLDVSSYLNGALPVALPNNDTLIYYDFLAEDMRQPVARMQMDPTNQFVSNAQYREVDTSTVAIRYIADELAVQIFPNPASHYIAIQTEEFPEGGYHIQVVDMTGRVVQVEQNIQTESYQMTTKALTNGHYILLLRNQKGNLIKRQQIDILK